MRPVPPGEIAASMYRSVASQPAPTAVASPAKGPAAPGKESSPELDGLLESLIGEDDAPRRYRAEDALDPVRGEPARCREVRSVEGEHYQDCDGQEGDCDLPDHDYVVRFREQA